MKPHTYTFQVRAPDASILECNIEATGKENAYLAACADTRFLYHKVLKATFKRLDTAKGANRAGGLDSNGKQLNARNTHDPLTTFQNHIDQIEEKAYKDFLKHLNKAIENLYLCHFENNGAVLSMPIKELYEAMKEYDPFK